MILISAITGFAGFERVGVGKLIFQGLGQIRVGIKLKRIFFFLANAWRFMIFS
jgi:hypothetical protein